MNASQSLIGSVEPGVSIVGSGNLLGVNPNLGPLAFNGGNTRTQELLTGSPAITAGSNPLGLTTDQRGAGFARVVGELAPAAAPEALHKPLTMMLFGMMNWTFTWLRDRGPLRYEDLAPVVADLFLGGLGRVRTPQRPVAARRTTRARTHTHLEASA